MNVKETYQIITFLRILNPRFYPNAKESEIESIVNAWATILESESFEIVKQAAIEVVKDIAFPPTIADIKSKIQLMTTQNNLTEMEAWSLVYKAICNSSYEAQEQFNKLPPIVQRIVGTPKQLREWGLTENLNVSVIQSNFMRSYKVMSDREEMIKKLPDSCKNLLNNQEDKLCLNVNSAEEKDI